MKNGSRCLSKLINDKCDDRVLDKFYQICHVGDKVRYNIFDNLKIIKITKDLVTMKMINDTEISVNKDLFKYYGEKICYMFQKH
jgi:uncharacterized protein YlbG (UPF0298 family)